MFDTLRFKLRKLMSGDKVKLLSIGLEHNYIKDCPGSKLDATRLYDKISPRCSYSKLLVNESATKANVITEMYKVCDSDLAIITYSGHGGRQRGSRNETDGYDELIYLYDQPMVDNEIWTIISKAKGRVFMIFDCCHSETLFCDNWKNMHDTFRIAGLPLNSIDLLCWSSCGESQFGYTTQYGSLFTNSILRNAKAGYTYDKAWSKIESDQRVSSYESVRRTFLKSDSKFKRSKLFS